VNNLHRRFLKTDESDGHCLAASRVATVVLLVLAGLSAWQMDSIAGAWRYLAKLGSGIGLGKLCVAQFLTGVVLLAVAAACGVVLVRWILSTAAGAAATD
jgi:hypothetical protein